MAQQSHINTSHKISCAMASYCSRRLLVRGVEKGAARRATGPQPKTAFSAEGAKRFASMPSAVDEITARKGIDFPCSGSAWPKFKSQYSSLSFNQEVYC